MTDAMRIIECVARSGQRLETPLSKGRLVWRIWGHGEPVVLLHGGYGSWLHWIRNVEDLSSRYRVVVPDMPGFGESGDLGEAASAFGIAEALLQGLNQIIGRGSSFRLAGFSFGGSIAGHLAVLAAGRAVQLVLVGAGGLRLPRPAPVDLVSWRHLQDPLEMREVHRSNLGTLMIHRRERIDDLAIAIQSMNAQRARTKSRPISRAGALHDVLVDLRVSLDGIWGEYDATSVGFNEARKGFLNSLDPDAAFAIVPDTGHWVQFEAAAAFNEILSGMLRRRGAVTK
jgi:2-hydroxy-6-oxonona-2,4-dienedioate hydrolase